MHSCIMSKYRFLRFLVFIRKISRHISDILFKIIKFSTRSERVTFTIRILHLYTD